MSGGSLILPFGPNSCPTCCLECQTWLNSEVPSVIVTFSGLAPVLCPARNSEVASGAINQAFSVPIDPPGTFGRAWNLITPNTDPDAFAMTFKNAVPSLAFPIVCTQVVPYSAGWNIRVQCGSGGNIFGVNFGVNNNPHGLGSGGSVFSGFGLAGAVIANTTGSSDMAMGGVCTISR